MAATIVHIRTQIPENINNSDFKYPVSEVDVCPSLDKRQRGFRASPPRLPLGAPSCRAVNVVLHPLNGQCPNIEKFTSPDATFTNCWLDV
jgi:hypothetical protein